MPRAKPPAKDDIRERRRLLQEDITHAGLPIAEAISRMRHALGMTQARFGQVFKLTTRQVWELENGKANPTLDTLSRIAAPFGFKVGFLAAPEAATGPSRPAVGTER